MEQSELSNQGNKSPTQSSRSQAQAQVPTPSPFDVVEPSSNVQLATNEAIRTIHTSSPLAQSIECEISRSQKSESCISISRSWLRVEPPTTSDEETNTRANRTATTLEFSIRRTQSMGQNRRFQPYPSERPKPGSKGKEKENSNPPAQSSSNLIAIRSPSPLTQAIKCVPESERTVTVKGMRGTHLPIDIVSALLREAFDEESNAPVIAPTTSGEGTDTEAHRTATPLSPRRTRSMTRSHRFEPYPSDRQKPSPKGKEKEIAKPPAQSSSNHITIHSPSQLPQEIKCVGESDSIVTVKDAKGTHLPINFNLKNIVSSLLRGITRSQSRFEPYPSDRPKPSPKGKEKENSKPPAKNLSNRVKRYRSIRKSTYRMVRDASGTRIYPPIVPSPLREVFTANIGKCSDEESNTQFEENSEPPPIVITLGRKGAKNVSEERQYAMMRAAVKAISPTGETVTYRFSRDGFGPQLFNALNPEVKLSVPNKR